MSEKRIVRISGTSRGTSKDGPTKDNDKERGDG